MAASERQGSETLGSSTSQIYFPVPFRDGAHWFVLPDSISDTERPPAAKAELEAFDNSAISVAAAVARSRLRFSALVWRGGPGLARHKPASAPLPLRSYVYVCLRRDSDPAGARARFPARATLAAASRIHLFQPSCCHYCRETTHDCEIS